MQKPITYVTLKSAMLDEFNESARPATSLGPTQRLRNLLTTLSSWRSFKQLHDDDPVGVELFEDYVGELARFASWLAQQGLSRQTISDRKAMLKRWRTLAIDLCLVRPLNDATATPVRAAGAFTAELCRLVGASGKSIVEINDAAGLPSKTLYGWLKGKQPAPSLQAAVARLERYFSLPRNALANLVIWYGRAVRTPTGGQAKPNSYRESHGHRVADRYTLRSNPPERLVREWKDFLLYKTDDEPPMGMERPPNAQWRLRAIDRLRPQHSKHWYLSPIPGLAAPTASTAWANTASFLGWLTLPVERGGFGIQRDDVTMAWFARADATDAYLRWYRARSNAVKHGGLALFIGFAASLVHPVHGYLTQQPSFALRLPPPPSPSEWAATCAQAHALYRKRLASSRRGVKRNRHPNVMPEILASQSPLAHLAGMLGRMQEDLRRAIPGTYHQAILGRDATLMAMLMANPLRITHYAIMTWREDNSGNLYRGDSGGWRIRLPAEDFKNGADFGDDAEYDIPVSPRVHSIIDDYVTRYRPLLLRGPTDFLFVAPRRRSHGRPWDSIDDAVVRVTRNYIPGCPGLGPHWIRHAVATDWLRTHPRDYVTVALLLRDTVQTVIRQYGHLNAEDGFRQYNKYVDELLPDGRPLLSSRKP